MCVMFGSFMYVTWLKHIASEKERETYREKERDQKSERKQVPSAGKDCPTSLGREPPF